MFESLANPNYRLFVSGQVVSQSGNWMQRIALAWLVLELTESPVALGTLTALQFLPILLLSLVAGTLADRYPRRRVLALVQLAGAAQAGLLTLLVATGWVQLWQVYLLALLQGTATAIEQPVRQAFPYDLVGRDLLTNAIALNSAIHNSARILGPALGGVVVAWLGSAAAFALNGATYLAVLVTLSLLRLDSSPAKGSLVRGSVVAQLAEGLRYAATTAPILLTLSVLCVLAIFGFNYSTFLPLLARYQLDLGPSGYGLLSAALGGGAIVGALALARWGRPSQPQMLAAGGLFCLLLAGVGLSASFPLSMALLALLGMAGTCFTTTANSLLQLTVPERMRGRIMGLYSLLLMGMTPPGAAFTGAVADAWGISTALQAEAAICLAGIAAGVVALARLRSTRLLPSPPETG